MNTMNAVDLLSIWTSFLPIANLVFAVVFALVIYSTATGQGLTNYSVKKILPRLIVVAIAVNVSFYICAILADLVNIVAVGIPDLLFGGWQGTNSMTTADQAAGIFSGFIGVVLLFLFGMVAVVATLVIVVALTARQIILSLLVVVSPLAVVCAVLPRTQKYFDKWLKVYVQLLVVYPMFMFVWAGVRWFQFEGMKTFVDGSDDMVAKVVEFLVKCIAPIIPLVAMLPLLKASGGAMSKLTGYIDKSPLGTQGALGKAAAARDAKRREYTGKNIGNMVRERSNKREQKLQTYEDNQKALDAAKNMEVPTVENEYKNESNYKKGFAQMYKNASSSKKKDLMNNYQFGLDAARQQDEAAQQAAQQAEQAKKDAAVEEAERKLQESGKGIKRARATSTISRALNPVARRRATDTAEQLSKMEQASHYGRYVQGRHFGQEPYSAQINAAPLLDWDKLKQENQKAMQVGYKKELGTDVVSATDRLATLENTAEIEALTDYIQGLSGGISQLQKALVSGGMPTELAKNTETLQAVKNALSGSAALAGKNTALAAAMGDNSSTVTDITNIINGTDTKYAGIAYDGLKASDAAGLNKVAMQHAANSGYLTKAVANQILSNPVDANKLGAGPGETHEIISRIAHS